MKKSKKQEMQKGSYQDSNITGDKPENNSNNQNWYERDESAFKGWFERFSKKPEMEKKKNKNREIILMTYIFVGLFTLLMGNFVIFMVRDSQEVINNTYNKRQDLLAERVHRGKILSKSGDILAHTIESGEESIRVYPYKNVFAHVVGRFSKGRTGIESTENFKLLASNINPIKRIFNELGGEKNPGDNIITTLDVNLQKIAYDALGSRKGAVVVLEPDTGKILAMVSKPDYDPNKIDSNWESLLGDGKSDGTDTNSALLNRATQGAYPPGSTFKILTALEYIREHSKYNKYSFECDGHETFYSVRINCYNNRQHGHLNLISAFAKSCNGAFADMGTKIDQTLLYNLSTDFLFNSDLPINMPYKKSSYVLTGSTDKSEIPQTVIGQGKTQISPFHNALIVSAIANGGILMTPYVVDRIEDAEGQTVKKNLPVVYKQLISGNEAKILTQLMTEVVKNGTASALNTSRYTAAGKTGSAEHAENKPAHAWYVGFAPAKKPKIAVSIIVEEVGTGSEYAVPIAKRILDAYFK